MCSSHPNHNHKPGNRTLVVAISVFLGYEITMKIALVASYFHVSFVKCVINHPWLFHIGFLVCFYLALSSSELKKLFTHVYFFFSAVVKLGSIKMKKFSKCVIINVCRQLKSQFEDYEFYFSN